MNKEQIIDAITKVMLDCNKLINYINIDSENADFYAEVIARNLNNVEQLKKML